MRKASFSKEFKRDVMAQITARGYPLAKVLHLLAVSQHSIDASKR